jgi:hypothetical protein
VPFLRWARGDWVGVAKRAGIDPSDDNEGEEQPCLPPFLNAARSVQDRTGTPIRQTCDIRPMASGSVRGSPLTAIMSASAPARIRPLRGRPSAAAPPLVSAASASVVLIPIFIRSWIARCAMSCGLPGPMPASVPTTTIPPSSVTRRIASRMSGRVTSSKCWERGGRVSATPERRR